MVLDLLQKKQFIRMMKYACALSLIAWVIMGFFVLDARRQNSPDAAQIQLRLEHKPEFVKHIGVLARKGNARGDSSALVKHVLEVIETGSLYPGLTRVGDVMELFRSELVFVTPHEAIVDLGRDVSLVQEKPIGITWVREDVKEPERHLHWVLVFYFSADSDLLADWKLTCLPSY